MTKIAIIGYGNLGKALERIACASDDLNVAGIFTRRDPKQMTSQFGAAFFKQDEIFDMAQDIDVACICTGSANDVTALGVRLAAVVNTVDSFDTHAKMSDYFAAMDKAATNANKLSIIGAGWDPGLFSLMRALFEGVLPNGGSHTFWGRGVSQGHSEAIRRIEGVLDARQYTVPKDEALRLAREGGATLSDRDKHFRECYVVAEDGADRYRIKRSIVEMPNYFAPYDTSVTFIDAEQMREEHSAMPHAGFVLRTGSANGNTSRLEFSLKLDSNPDFTAAVMAAYARANVRLASKGECGARTVLDIPVSALFDDRAEVIKFI